MSEYEGSEQERVDDAREEWTIQGVLDKVERIEITEIGIVADNWSEGRIDIVTARWRVAISDGSIFDDDKLDTALPLMDVALDGVLPDGAERLGGRLMRRPAEPGQRP